MVAITVFLVVTSINKDIDFSRWEKMGNEYQRPLGRLLELIPQHEALTRRNRDQATTFQKQAAAVAAEIDRAFTDLARVQNKFGEALQFTPHGLEQRKRAHVLPENVASEWKELTHSASKLTQATRGERHVHLVSDVRTMIMHAGDTSNLILDPDLDSYYLMDISLLALPQNQDRLAMLSAFAEGFSRDSSITATQRTQLSLYAALLKESDFALLSVGCATRPGLHVNS